MFDGPELVTKKTIEIVLQTRETSCWVDVIKSEERATSDIRDAARLIQNAVVVLKTRDSDGFLAKEVLAFGQIEECLQGKVVTPQNLQDFEREFVEFERKHLIELRSRVELLKESIDLAHGPIPSRVQG
jgi:hypothetical protein